MKLASSSRALLLAAGASASALAPARASPDTWSVNVGGSGNSQTYLGNYRGANAERSQWPRNTEFV